MVIKKPAAVFIKKLSTKFELNPYSLRVKFELKYVQYPIKSIRTPLNIHVLIVLFID